MCFTLSLLHLAEEPIADGTSVARLVCKSTLPSSPILSAPIHPPEPSLTVLRMATPHIASCLQPLRLTLRSVPARMCADTCPMYNVAPTSASCTKNQKTRSHTALQAVNAHRPQPSTATPPANPRCRWGNSPATSASPPEAAAVLADMSCHVAREYSRAMSTDTPYHGPSSWCLHTRLQGVRHHCCQD